MKDKMLPFIHMIPKFHKETLDYRYIAAAKTSSYKYAHNMSINMSQKELLTIWM